jgi:hypothetical protein
MKIRWVTACVAALAVLALGSLTVFAESPRPECDRTDSASLCQANITIFVFVDRVTSGGGAFYESGVDSPLEGARITFVMPDGSRQQEVTGRTGLLSFPDVNFLPGDEAFIEVEYPARYRDAALVPCRSSPVRRRITHDAFGSFGSTQVVFCARQYLSTPTGP